MQTSLFRIVSVGVVAENKTMAGEGAGFNKDIKAVLVEDLTMLDGEISSNPTSIEIKGVDRHGKAFATKVNTDNPINATWLPFGSNRVTAPDVRRGMRVFLWQNADADKYYWTDTGLDGHLFKLETVVLAFSATKDESAGGFDINNCYYLEVSTHNKAITLQTSSANGEPFEYTFQFNTNEGAVVLQDNVGNFFELDSEEKKLTLKNAAQSHVILDKTKINIKATDEVKIDVGGTQVTMTPSGTIWKTPQFKGLT